ncbi:MAG: hypothetical protein AB8B55_07235 [Mariniblastus sp.]
MCQPLCHFNGAYSSAYHHALKATEMAPRDASLKEFLLFFNCVPDKPMNDKKAADVARELLNLDPDSELSKGVLAKS